MWGTAAAELERFEAVEPHMGTLVRLVLYAETPTQADTAFKAAFARVRELDDRLSDYKENSELNRLCRAPAGEPVPVSEDLFRVLAAAQKIAEETGGALDVTVGDLTHAWRRGELPAAPEPGGYRRLRLNQQARTVTLASTLQLDLGAIAKGFAGDEALKVLIQQGCPRALVALSGDIVAGDAPPGKSGWSVQAGATGEVVALRHQAMSTAGSTEQHLDRDGKRYSHILDPRTGKALETAKMVTVIAPTGTEADGLDTTICVLSAAETEALLRKHPDARALVR